MGELSKKKLNYIEAAKVIGVPVVVFRNLILRGDIGIKGEVINGITKFDEKELLEWNLLRKPNLSKTS